jgi:hypothetical protein
MKRLLTGIVIGSLVMLLSGCASTGGKGLVMARFQDIKPDGSPQTADVFGPGEVPSAYVYGYDDQTVTIEIFDIASGALVKKQTSYIPKGKDYYWVLSDLPQGSYKTVISTGGTSREMRLFNIRK